MTAEAQLKVLISNQKALIQEEESSLKKAELTGFAAGFLNGLRLANRISNKQYHTAYREIMKVGGKLNEETEETD